MVQTAPRKDFGKRTAFKTAEKK